jgi:hypothetical protein
VSASFRRAALIAVLAAALVGTGVADRLVGRGAPATVRPPDALADLHSAPRAGTESSAWYCAGGTGAQGGAPATIAVTNASGRPATATVTAVPAQTGQGAPPAPWAGAHTTALRVPAYAEVTVPATALGGSTGVAAAVVVDGGGVAVAEGVSSPLGWSMAPCASTTSPDWYFAHGATSQGGGLTLSLFNPGATDATVDVSLVVPGAGVLEPAAYQGIGVAPGSLVTENVGDHAPQDAVIATEVSTLAGSVVASEVESVGTPGAGGLSLTLGTPSPAATWVFAQNTDVTGGTVAFHVFNPSAQPAVVSVALGLPQGAAAEPFTLTVPSQSVSTLVAENETRIPSDVPYAVSFTSRGADVVVSRQVTGPPAAPAPLEGDAPGLPGGLRRWLVSSVVPPGTGAWSLGVVDMGTRPTEVRVLTPKGTAFAGRSTWLVRPGTPLFIGPGLGAPYGTAPFEVEAQQPVAVELDGVPVGAPGAVVVPALSAP